jgi:hypothetical protein
MRFFRILSKLDEMCRLRVDKWGVYRNVFDDFIFISLFNYLFERLEIATICLTFLFNKSKSGKIKFAIFQKPIGKGASCLVYKAFDKSRDSMVAIKVVSLQKLNVKSNEEIRREIELLQNLKSEDCIINFYGHEVWFDIIS